MKTTTLYQKKSIIRDMIRLIKKWWLVRKLQKECSKTAINQATPQQLSYNLKPSVAREAMVTQIAKRAVKRFSIILWWRKKENQVKLSKKIHEYNSIFNSCIKEELIEVLPDNSLIKDSSILNPSGRPFFCTTVKGDDFTGFFPLLEELLLKYKLSWSLLIIPLIFGVLSSPYIRQLISNIIR